MSDGCGAARKETERWTCCREETHGGGAVVHPQRLLHVGAQEHLATAEGAGVQVHVDAEGSASIEVPVKLLRGDVGATCGHDGECRSSSSIGRLHIPAPSIKNK